MDVCEGEADGKKERQKHSSLLEYSTREGERNKRKKKKSKKMKRKKTVEYTVQEITVIIAIVVRWNECAVRTNATTKATFQVQRLHFTKE